MNKDSDCLFCRIVAGAVPADKIWENDEFLAINDAYPKAPVHALIIPKKHISTLNEIGGEDAEFCRGMLKFITDTAEKLGVVDPGYRVIANVGRGGGQEIFHLHWHLIAGKMLGF